MTTIASSAGRAFKAGRRRRAARSAVENVVDGLLAGGGLLLANASLSLGIGLPEGAAGMSLGGSLLAAGFAWLTRGRRRPTPTEPLARIAVVAPIPVAAPVARRAA